MKKIKISIRRSSFFILIATATFTLFSISVLWVFTEIIKSKEIIAEIKETYESEQREFLKSEVKKVVSLINFSRKYGNHKSTVELQEKILDYVSTIRLIHGGYIFINTYDGRALIFDGVKIIGKKDVNNMTDPDGLKLFDIELNLVNNPEGGFFKYKFKRLDSFTPVPKLSYVYGYNDWEWIIGAGIYLDDLGIFIQESKNQHIEILLKKILYIILLFIGLLGIVLAVAMFLSGFIKREFSVFMSFLTQRPDDISIIDREKLHVEEFKELAHSANIMIKQRRFAEKLLKKERDKAHKYLNVADVIILALDRDGIVTLINKKGYLTLGYREEDIVGKNWFNNFVPVSDKHKLYTNFLYVISGDGKLSFKNEENKIITKAGKERIISWQNTLLYDDEGNIAGSLSSGNDITKSRFVESSYFESEEKYKLLFERTSDPVLIIGRNDTFIDCNNAAVKILGFKDKNELFETHPGKISPIKQPDGQLSIIKAGDMIDKARREGYNRFEWLHVNKRKKPFYVDVSLTLIPISGSEYLYVVWRDISKRKKQDQELIIAKEKAEQSDNIKTSFLHNMQHEIRTPLNSLMGFAQLLKKQNLNAEEAEEYYESIISSGNQLHKIIDEIIDFSRLQSGYILISNEPVELKKLLTEIFKEYYSNTSKPIKFTINTCPSDKNTIIETDLPRLKQIILHLLSNAFKFTEKGNVDLKYSISGKDITFTVTDTGVGIEKKHFESIFDRFTRLTHDNPEKLYGGSGLGLSISKAIVGFLGGRIWVESEIGRGSRFSFTIPYKPLVVNSMIKKDCLKGKSISVVTNHNDKFIRISNSVEGSGAKLTQIKNGMEAVESCQKDYKTDLMIIDFDLSGMKGMTITKAIKAFKNELPIIALITYDFKTPTKEDALVSGCDDYITLSQKGNDIKLTLSLYLNNDILAYS
ncbi:MAG: PAS domain S-box protein [Bacteroidetes bacterium]|nr:PAS domain S-box protein [Bacteroidota bacterium]MBL6943642.1 PAS domain S-box protein [Bacteroidales bacterium]